MGHAVGSNSRSQRPGLPSYISESADRQQEQNCLLPTEQIIAQSRAYAILFEDSPVEPKRQKAMGAQVQVTQGPGLDDTQGLSGVDGTHLGLILRPSQIAAAHEQFLDRTAAFRAGHDAQVVSV